jgi:hypothetical protein
MRPQEKLEVYWIAQEFAAFCTHVRPRIQEVSPADAHDLDKSSGSIPNNICEAANESSPGDIARFFRYAKRENGEAFWIARPPDRQITRCAVLLSAARSARAARARARTATRR